MERGIQGSLLKQGTGIAAFQAFSPAPLPPSPDLLSSPEISKALSDADLMLGRLDGLSLVLKSPDLLIYFYTRKEAVLSSQIEGTQSTLSQLLRFEIEPATTNLDVLEVSNYVAAMRHGLDRMAGGFPLSLRLLREMHAVLLRSGRGSDRTPGEFRRSQNWIGGTMPGNAIYVPPPVQEMDQALHAFELFMDGKSTEFPVLIQCALLHLQFETIHPFLDGNGRLGRLLMTLLLVRRAVLREPLLYMSLYLKQNKQRYYDLLQSVRMLGDWEEWTLFFLEGVRITAERAVSLAQQLLALGNADEERLRGLAGRRGSAFEVLKALQHSPYSSARTVAVATGLTSNTALATLEGMQEMGIVSEITGRERGKIFCYSEYVRLLSEGTELD